MVKDRLVYAVGEEDHGVIAIADSVNSAVEALITSDWVTIETSVVFCSRERKYVPIGDAMERLGYLDSDGLNDFMADMLTNRVKGYEWNFYFHTISFCEEV